MSNPRHAKQPTAQERAESAEAGETYARMMRQYRDRDWTEAPASDTAEYWVMDGVKKDLEYATRSVDRGRW
jgi:hypothetical protein